MKNFAIVAVVVVIAICALLFFVSPAFRAGVKTKVDNVTKWTDDAIKNDPLGYYNYVENRLSTDLKQLDDTLYNLRVEVGEVSKGHAEKTKALGEIQEMVDEFVDAKVNAGDTFPITVVGKEYSEAQLRSQVDLLIAEKDGLAASATALESVASTGNEMVKNLIVNREKTNTDLTILKAKREMFVAGKLSSEGLEMAKNLDNLLKGNERAVEDFSVRSFDELKKARLAEAAKQAKAKPTLFDELVKQRKVEKAKPIQQQMNDEPAGEEPASKKGEGEEKSKPIFKQS